LNAASYDGKNLIYINMPPRVTIILNTEEKHRLRRLVIEYGAGRLVGIVTMEDLLELFARELADLALVLAGAREREVAERA
jgi:CBS domain-containing protein